MKILNNLNELNQALKTKKYETMIKEKDFNAYLNISIHLKDNPTTIEGTLYPTPTIILKNDTGNNQEIIIKEIKTIIKKGLKNNQDQYPEKTIELDIIITQLESTSHKGDHEGIIKTNEQVKNYQIN